MGFRFQKRIQILPGVRLNLSKGGASWSFGPRGASVNVGKRGTYGTVGIPGSGLSYRERLDKPKGRSPSAGRAPAPTGPQMPERVIARLVDNEIQFLDQDERLLDPALVPAAKSLMKDDIKGFLEEHEAERNNSIDALRHLHHDIPVTVATVQPGSQGKPQRESFPSQEAYMEALMSWRADQANSGPSEDDVGDALLEALGALEWPAETNIAISLQGGRLLLDVDLPEIEDMPQTRWKAVISRTSLEEKPMAKKDVAAIYLDHVCSVIVRLIGHSMAASGAIHTVGISAYTQRKTATGGEGDEYVAAVEVPRAAWSQVDCSQMSAIDPHNLLRHLGARIDANSRGILLVQTPIT